ncbi:hypothetical protein CkaCkLH20_03786 [Colletotrichum karsti]|uniref:Uncharacterized protein n=1 Tax=Colletotrichum karsti TaxID=1095194 RepID=A0A9P6IE63_9PEZI|nr:uncharacterized protein CkaCkLH20_03786 [Colletotrichum karsti]KAF9878886.1 hypothetical protein CkaCkLH20_03786 [Colletotrichum karsti]
MRFDLTFSVFFVLALVAECKLTWVSTSQHDNEVSCLCEDEAWDIAKRWLSIFSTGGVSSKAEVATIVSANLTSYDETEGGPLIGIDQFWDAVSAEANSNSTATNVTQTPVLLLHSCDQIAYNWQLTAVTTGLNS